MSAKIKPALVIMAAGIGSRYGGGIKQLEPVGANGEIIMDYSIHDAIAAGFRKIIFVIRHDIEQDFREVIGNRIEQQTAHLGVSFHYAFQELEDLPAIHCQKEEASRGEPDKRSCAAGRFSTVRSR